MGDRINKANLKPTPPPKKTKKKPQEGLGLWVWAWCGISKKMVNKKKIICPPPLLYHHLLLSLSLIPIIVTKTWLTLISHSDSNSYLAFLYPTSPSQTPSYYYSLLTIQFLLLNNSLSSFLLYLFFFLPYSLGFGTRALPFFLKEGFLFYIYSAAPLLLELSSKGKVFWIGFLMGSCLSISINLLFVSMGL